MGVLTYTCLDVVMGMEVVITVTLHVSSCLSGDFGVIASLSITPGVSWAVGLMCLSLSYTCVCVVQQRPLVYNGHCCNGCAMLGLGSLYLRQPVSIWCWP